MGLAMSPLMFAHFLYSNLWLKKMKFNAVTVLSHEAFVFGQPHSFFPKKKKTLKKKNRCFRHDQVFVNPNPLSFPLWHQTYISIGGFCQFFTKILCALSFSYISTVVLFMMTNSHSLSRGLKIQLYKYRGDSFSNTCLHHNEVEAPPFRSLGSSSHSLEINVVINSVMNDVKTNWSPNWTSL